MEHINKGKLTIRLATNGVMRRKRLILESSGGTIGSYQTQPTRKRQR
jgi:hypothetical protein